MKPRLFWVLASAWLGGCETTRLASPSALDLRRELVERNWELVHLGQARDVEGSAALHATDAILLPPGGEVVFGRSAIRDFLRVPESVSLLDPSFDDLQVGGNDDCAYLAGTYRYTVEEAGSTSEVRGPFLVVWTRDAAGEWQVQVDAWHVAR